MQGLLLSIMNLQLVGAIPVHHPQTKYLPHIHPEHSLHMHTQHFTFSHSVQRERERKECWANLIRVKIKEKLSGLSARGPASNLPTGAQSASNNHIYSIFPRLLFLVDVSLKPVLLFPNSIPLHVFFPILPVCRHYPPPVLSTSSLLPLSSSSFPLVLFLSPLRSS